MKKNHSYKPFELDDLICFCIFIPAMIITYIMQKIEDLINFILQYKKLTMGLFNNFTYDKEEEETKRKDLLKTFHENETDKNSNDNKSKEEKLRTRLNYLNEIDEVRWVKFDGNEVYIGFNPIPFSNPKDAEDGISLDMIIGFAAFHGNKASNYEVHVYAVDAKLIEMDNDLLDTLWFRGCTAEYGRVQRYYSNSN